MEWYKLTLLLTIMEDSLALAPKQNVFQSQLPQWEGIDPGTWQLPLPSFSHFGGLAHVRHPPSKSSNREVSIPPADMDLK